MGDSPLYPLSFLFLLLVVSQVCTSSTAPPRSQPCQTASSYPLILMFSFFNMRLSRLLEAGVNGPYDRPRDPRYRRHTLLHLASASGSLEVQYRRLFVSDLSYVGCELAGCKSCLVNEIRRLIISWQAITRSPLFMTYRFRLLTVESQTNNFLLACSSWQSPASTVTRCTSLLLAATWGCDAFDNYYLAFLKLADYQSPTSF